MIEKFKIKTISEKITLSIFIIIAICVLFSTLIIPRVIEGQLEKKYEVEKAAATESLSYSLAPVLELYDYKQVERIITSSLAYENIARITVFNTGGILIVSASEQNVSSENLDIEEHEITSGDRVIGYFEISFTGKHIDEQITTTTLALVSGLVGFLLLAGIALFIFINRSVIKPIVLFTKTVRQMDSKNLSKRVNIKSNDELGTLAKSFNQMAENLSKSHTALEKAHDGLEVKVEQRTKQLKKALFKEKEALAILENSNWEIKNLRKQIDFILSAARTTLHIVDSDFNIIYVDPGRQKIYGDSKGLRCYEYFMGYQKPCSDCTVPKALSTKDAIVSEKILEKEDNKPILLTTVPFQNETGKWLSAEVMVDITERKQMEEETIAAKEMADAANKAKSEFLSGMSHELRTPLNAVIGFSQVLQEEYFGKLNEKQADYIKDILDSGRHLLSLINDILDLSKIEAGKMELELSSVRIGELMRDSLTMIKEKALSHGINLDTNMQGIKDLEILADERRIKQVMFNLLSNAIKFTPDGGAIIIEGVIKDSHLIASVSDTGIGLSSEDREKVFEDFYQASGGRKSKTAGTGLGLPLTRSILEMHGGRIWADSDGLGKGSRFTFTLPIRIITKDSKNIRG